MIEQLIIFVEGTTDELFIREVFNDELLRICHNYTIFKYSKRKKEKVIQYITTRKKIKNWDYIFIADQDGDLNKKNNVISKYNNLEEKNVFISIYEIESWIIAGISEKILKKHKINYNCTDTSIITKEKFINIIPKTMDKLEFISYILNDYDLENAVKFNESLNVFSQYLYNKKQAKDCF